MSTRAGRGASSDAARLSRRYAIAAALRFGGWARRRRLPAGRYRLRAVPANGEAGAGPARHAYFTLRR